MIYPTATELLRTIDVTLAEKVEPSLSDLTGRSALATVRHLLNFVRVRIEGEGQILSADITAMRELLTRIADYHESVGDAADAASLRDGLTAIVPGGQNGAYRPLNDLALEAGALSDLLHEALARLQVLRPDRRDDPAYLNIRAAIRNHLKVQIEEEGTLVAPAFFGRGPRR